MSSTYQCQSDLAPEYYGLGVRLGIYFSWLNGWIANVFLASEIKAANDTNLVFLVTLWIAMTSDSVRKTLFAVDGLVLMHLSSGPIFGILTLFGYRTRVYMEKGPGAIREFGSFGTHLRIIISLGVAAWGIWFWWFGVTGHLRVMGPDDGVSPPNPIECSTLYTWFFVSFDVVGPIRWFYVAICACCIAYYGIMVLVSLVAGYLTVQRLFGRVRGYWAGQANTSKFSRPAYVTGFTSTELVIIHKILRVFSLAWLIFTAVMVEVTLNLNKMNSVLSRPGSYSLSTPGQLLPFLVGLASFIQTCYVLFKQEVLQRNLKVKTSARKGGASTEKRNYDRRLLIRWWPLRYLVGWLPWLSLLRVFDDKLERVGISRESTGHGGYDQISMQQSAGTDTMPLRQEYQDYRQYSGGYST